MINNKPIRTKNKVKNVLRILYVDFDQKGKNFQHETKKHHYYKKA